MGHNVAIITHRRWFSLSHHVGPEDRTLIILNNISQAPPTTFYFWDSQFLNKCLILLHAYTGVYTKTAWNLQCQCEPLGPDHLISKLASPLNIHVIFFLEILQHILSQHHHCHGIAVGMKLGVLVNIKTQEANRTKQNKNLGHWGDDSGSKNAFCIGTQPWIWIPSTHMKKKGKWKMPAVFWLVGSACRWKENLLLLPGSP